MIWLAWRRQRVQLVSWAVLVVGLGLWMLYTAFQHEAEGRELARVGCNGILHRTIPTGGAAAVDLQLHCSQLQNSFDWGNGTVSLVVFLVAALPVAIGAFLGAPLVADEFRRRTHRMVWTQSVSRTRWLLTSVAVVVVGAVIPVAFLVAVLPRWKQAYPDRFSSGVAPGQFNVSGFDALAYLLFALALGVLLGVLLRSSAPAVVGVLVLYPVTRWGVEGLRAHFLPAATAASPDGSVPAGGWYLGEGWLPIGRSGLPPGRSWGYYSPPASCSGTGWQGSGPCAATNGLHWAVTYQPASRFWAFQGIEAFVFVGLAALCLGAAVLLVRRWSR